MNRRFARWISIAFLILGALHLADRLGLLPHVRRTMVGSAKSAESASEPSGILRLAGASS